LGLHRAGDKLVFPAHLKQSHKERKYEMKKILFSMLLVATLLMLGVAPLMAAPASVNTSDSAVSGNISQQTDGVINTSGFGVTLNKSGAGAGGGQISSASFGANPSDPVGESAQGNASLNGQTTVQATTSKVGGVITSTANGSTQTGLPLASPTDVVNVSEQFNSGGAPTAFSTLSGSGQMQANTLSQIGLGSDGKLAGNGTFAQTTGYGSFSFNVNSPAGAPYLNWEAAGITTVGGTSTSAPIVVGGKTIGYTSSSSATVSSSACPVGTK